MKPEKNILNAACDRKFIFLFWKHVIQKRLFEMHFLFISLLFIYAKNASVKAKFTSAVLQTFVWNFLIWERRIYVENVSGIFKFSFRTYKSLQFYKFFIHSICIFSLNSWHWKFYIQIISISSDYCFANFIVTI